jgi:hypothetical protein
MSMSVEELAMSYHQAWTDLDPGVIAALHSEDSVFHMHGIGDPAIGRVAEWDVVALIDQVGPLPTIGAAV